MYIIINELEKDVLREIISIGLARAADSFSTFTKEGVLLDVPDVKIIEPKILPEVIDEYEEIYYVVRSGIQGELQGRTFLLFSAENLEHIAQVCLEGVRPEAADYEARKDAMMQDISTIITQALARQLGNILKVELGTEEPVLLFSRQASSIHHILEDIPEFQPFVITIKTHFRKLVKAVELPMLVVFDSMSVSRLLRLIRRDNLYDYKLLKINQDPE
ncbi:MAG: chemotaxis protein CheC [Adhaeribacter sp.]